MSSVIEQRNILVQQNVPKLIKALTGFNSRDENFKACLQFCFSRFKYHRNLSVNSHEVKRDVDGICEKLRFSNFHDTEQKFKKLVEDCVTHELAVNHYEKDVMYAIINLLTTLTHDPIGNLTTKTLGGENVIKFEAATKKAAKKASDIFITSLLKDNFKLQKNETDSELSEWSSCDEESSDDSDSDKTVEETPELPKKSGDLKPPEKPSVFKTVTDDNPEKWLRDNIQHSWWTDQISIELINSEHMTANFCTLWQKHLSNKSLGFIKPRPLSLVSEYCLLRELLWMFLNPVDCKFFKLEGDEFVLRQNVSLPSTMPESLNIFLDDFLRSINLMFHLRNDCLKSYQSSTLSHTLETYFKIVQEILDRISSFVLTEEAIVKAQEETYTIVVLHNKLRPHAKMLEMLWKIHKTSILDDGKFPPHICASFLLASLNQHIQSSCNKDKKNLAIVLLMTCIRPYLEIFEIWWTEARLGDLKNEFLMEKCEDGDFEVIIPRLLEKSKEKSFYLNDDVSKSLKSDKVIDTMLRYSIKASFTLDIISKLDRVHEMRQTVNESTSLHDEFVEKINDEILKFSQQKEGKKIEIDQTEVKRNKVNEKLVEDIRNGLLADGDGLMLLAFQSTFDKLTAGDTSNTQEPDSSELALYDALNEASNFILLPLEHSIVQVLNELLLKKIAIAERFVMNIYFHEFNVEQHLLDVRKVFFVESNELINFFCLKLFPVIETGESTWASSYLLTVALNDALWTSRQHSSTMFSVKVKRKFNYRTVFDAVNEITLGFNVNQNLINIFTPKLMEKYNDVFRFLLKIKYGQQILNCLRFPDFFKRRTPYAKLQLIDLVIKRLSLTRFGMLHLINSLHSHLMVMLNGLSFQLDAKVEKAQNISQLIACHEAFVEAFHSKALLGPESATINAIVIETLKLAKVLKEEWKTVVSFAALDEAGSIDTISLSDLDNNAIQIDKSFNFCESQLKILLDI